MSNRTAYVPTDCACDCGCIKQFTLVAETDFEFSTVPDYPRPLKVAKGDSVTFTSADHLYIRAREASETGGRDG